ncbi:hypothetical protein O3G_MSEX001960 [Manduca sexta]|uniref:FLYWCH-type domain-containing protein n=1 Tax=Manduca sexta TaxID=7130 RepID=A0A922CD22_MANSE|nr:hypothetical protein O3G_MSEX001960 [Manduca sexta]
METHIIYTYINDSDEDYDENSKDVAIFLKTHRGSMLLKLNGYKYRKTYKTKHGTRWVCSSNKYCSAHLVVSDMDEIVAACEVHNHNKTKSAKTLAKPLAKKEKAVLVISRNGNINLIHRKFAYRKKYSGTDRSRWVCATEKACRACIFVDNDYHVVSGIMDHMHSPPKIHKSLSDLPLLDEKGNKINKEDIYKRDESN